MNFKTLGLITILIALILFTLNVLANVKAERIKMNTSEECIEQIKNVAEKVEGVIQANWDEDSDELEILFEGDETSLLEIEKAISEAGFDTPKFKAQKAVSNKAKKECDQKNTTE